MDRDEILDVLRAFETEGLEYVLIGATAMGVHGVIRATEDVDLFVRATPGNIERLRSAFRTVYRDDPHIEEISTDDLLGEYPAVRYYPPRGDLFFDVLTRLGDVADFESVDREIKEVEGVQVIVATPAALYRLKKGTVRAKDHQDAAAPVQKFRSIDEMNRAPALERDGAMFDRFVRHCARYRRLARQTYPRGVFKFRTLAEAQHAREQAHGRGDKGPG